VGTKAIMPVEDGVRWIGGLADLAEVTEVGEAGDTPEKSS
jgi:hypothetical protein